MGNTSTSTKTLFRLVSMALLAGLSVVAVLFRFPLLPAATFLEYDFADVLVFIGTCLFGPWSGLLILLVAAVIQALTVSAGSGWIGLVMHLVSSGVMVLILGLFYTKMQNRKLGLLLGLLCGAAAMIAVMVPLNLFFMPMFTGLPRTAIVEMILPVILPFNTIKAAINCAATVLLFLPLQNRLKKMQLI